MNEVLSKALDMLAVIAAKLGQTAGQLFPEVARYMMAR